MNHFNFSFIKWILLWGVVLLSGCRPETRMEPTSATTVPVQTPSTPLLTIVETSTKPLQTIPVTPENLVPSTLAPIAKVTPNILFTPSETGTPTTLKGPLIGFRMQNDYSYLLLLDVGTLEFREVKQKYLESPFDLDWLDSGCLLYARGNLIDLKGNIVVKTNDPENGSEHFQVQLLSPNKEMGVREVYLGNHQNVELDYLSLEILDRTDPDLRITLAPNGGAYAFDWSPDGNWLAFSDYDDNFILQVYRATSDGQKIEQLTSHQEDPGVINLIKWSPNGQRIAYAASALLPDQFEAGRGGWVGLISLPDLHTMSVAPDKFVYTNGLWWDLDSKRIAFVGEGFPNISSIIESQGTQTQIYWADGETGMILNSFDEEQAPMNSLNLVLPVGNLDTIFFAAKDGYYLLDTTTNIYEKILDNIPMDDLIRDFTTFPFDFPGEANCLSH